MTTPNSNPSPTPAHPASQAERVVQALLGETGPELPPGQPDDPLVADIAKQVNKQWHANFIASRGKPVDDYSIRDHGVMASGYFQGAGTSGTKWDGAYVGTGNTAHEALEEALADAGEDGWDTHSILNNFPAETDDTVERAVRYANPDLAAEADAEGEDIDTGDCYYYVSLYIRGESQNE